MRKTFTPKFRRQQALLWLFLYLMGFSFTSQIAGPWVALLRVSLSIPILALIFYANSWYFYPRFYEKKQYVLYLLTYLGFVFLLAYLRNLLDTLIVPDPNIPYKQSHPLRMGVAAFHFMNSIGVGIMSYLYTQAMEAVRLRTLQKDLQNQQLEAELNFLKSQINPHFLFNTLNNIYTLAYIKSDAAPEMIAKLSELMRYMLYESDVPQILLDQEIAFIRHYTDLYRLRTSDEQRLHFEVDGESALLMIEPLLFIPLVENSFKYCNLQKPDGRIRIHLQILPAALIFSVQNRINQAERQNDRFGGIGLQNLRQRLNLLYPDRHELETKQQDDVYHATLTLYRT